MRECYCSQPSARMREGYCVCVCVCVCPSVTALAASGSVFIRKQQYARVSLRLFLDFESWNFEKNFCSKVTICNKLELTASHFRAVSGPTKHSS